MKYYLEIKT